jgi:hypothetical protein
MEVKLALSQCSEQSKVGYCFCDLFYIHIRTHLHELLNMKTPDMEKIMEELFSSVPGTFESPQTLSNYTKWAANHSDIGNCHRPPGCYSQLPTM